MLDDVTAHYSGRGELVDAIASRLRKAGLDPADLRTSDLAPVDEYHIRGRKATLELADLMKLDSAARVLDIGSGLGGPARTLAEVYG